MTTYQVDALVERLQAALSERQHLLPQGFSCHAAARRMADRYLSAADGTSGFWIVRPRATTNPRRVTPPVYEVVRSDGRDGVWNASTPEEGDVIADVLTTLSL